MKFYDYLRSSAAYRVRIALALKGLRFEKAEIDLSAGVQHGEDYLSLNPQGLVPALEEDGQVLFQSLAIIEYLEETHPEPRLLPGHPADRARVRGLAQMIACDIHPLNNLRVRKYLGEKFGQDEAAVEEWIRHWTAEGFEAIEAVLADDGLAGDFCHADEPGLADLCLIPQCVVAARVKLDLAPYPTIRRIHANAMKLEAFEKTKPDK